MLFWTALSLALSLRLALARSGVESSKLVEPGFQFLTNPSSIAHAGHDCPGAAAGQVGGKAGEEGGAHGSTSTTCGGRSQALGDSTEPVLDTEPRRPRSALPRPAPSRPSGLDSGERYLREECLSFLTFEKFLTRKGVRRLEWPHKEGESPKPGLEP